MDNFNPFVVGAMVSWIEPCIFGNGQATTKKESGRILAALPDGRFEIRCIVGGYVKKLAMELTPWPTTPTPEVLAHCAAVVAEEAAETEAASLAFDLAAVAHHVTGQPLQPVASGVTVDADYLRGAVARVAASVDSKALLPILHHVLIEGADTGDRLTLTTTDLDTATRATIPAAGCVAGFAACVPLDALSGWLARVPKGAALTLDAPKGGEIAPGLSGYGHPQASHKADLAALTYTKNSGRKSRLELAAMPPEDFPVIPTATAGRVVKCKAGAFGAALLSVLPYALKERLAYGGREILAGVHIAAVLNGLTFTGCDANRVKTETVSAFMPAAELTMGAGEIVTAILPATACKAVVEACKAAGPDADLTLRIESVSVGFEINGVEIFARVIEGDWPESVAEVVANFAPALAFEVDRAAFVKQLQAIGGKFNAAGVVEFDFTRGGDCLELHGYSADGARSVETVALISAAGADSCEVFGMQAKFLLQALPPVKAAKKSAKCAAVAPLLIEVGANPETGEVSSVRIGGAIIRRHKTRAQLAAEAGGEVEEVEEVDTVDAATIEFETPEVCAVDSSILAAAPCDFVPVPAAVKIDGAALAAARILEAENAPIPAAPVCSLDVAQLAAVGRVAQYVAQLKAAHAERAAKLQKSFDWQVSQIEAVIEFHAAKGRDALRALEIWERGAMAAAQKKVTA